MPLEVHPFRPFIDPWPPMAPKVPLNPGRRSFGEAGPSSVPADVNRLATRAELAAANKAVGAYAEKLDQYDGQYRALYAKWWEEWDARSVLNPIDNVATIYTAYVYGPDEVNRAFDQWVTSVDATRSTIAQLGDETLFGVRVLDGKQVPVTVGRLREIYGFLSRMASSNATTVLEAQNFTPDAVTKAFWGRASADLEGWAKAFKELADGLRDLIEGVGKLAQGAGRGVEVVSWIAPALVVAGLGFFLWLKASEARKRSGV